VLSRWYFLRCHRHSRLRRIPRYTFRRAAYIFRSSVHLIGGASLESCSIPQKSRQLRPLPEFPSSKSCIKPKTSCFLIPFGISDLSMDFKSSQPFSPLMRTILPSKSETLAFVNSSPSGGSCLTKVTGNLTFLYEALRAIHQQVRVDPATERGEATVPWAARSPDARNENSESEFSRKIKNRPVSWAVFLCPALDA